MDFNNQSNKRITMSNQIEPINPPIDFAIITAGDYFKARCYYQQGLEIKKELNEVWGSSVQFHNLAKVAHRLGELNESCELYQKSLVISRQLEDKRLISVALAGMGCVLVDLGDQMKTLKSFHESLDAAKIIGDKSVLLRSIYGLATLSINRKGFDSATTLLSILDGIYRSIGAHLSPEEQNNYENMVSLIKMECRDPIFSLLWMKGQEMSFDQIIDFSQNIRH